MHCLDAQLLCSIEVPEVRHRRQFQFGQDNSLVHLCITPSVGRGGNCYVPDHSPFQGVQVSFKRAVPVAFEQGSAKVSKEAGGCRHIEQDEAGGALEPLINAARVVPLHDPLFAPYRLFVQAKELFVDLQAAFKHCVGDFVPCPRL